MTAMIPQRIAVKFFASPDPAAKVDLHPFIGLFHRFIQERRLPGLLIDVADYAHVPEGPGILLVGHDVDYGLDLVGGRAGLLTTRKRYGRDAALRDTLRDTLRRALVAIQAVEEAEETDLRFSAGDLVVQLFDRRVTPNSDDAYGAVEGEVSSILGEVYAGAGAEVSRAHTDDARKALAFSLTAPDADAAVLLERLGGAPPVDSSEPVVKSQWEISAEDLKGLRDEGAAHVLLDVREQDEVDAVNLGGVHIPLRSLVERMEELDKSSRIVVHCKVGGRGARATRALREAGYEDAWNLEGGIMAWIERIDPSLPRY